MSKCEKDEGTGCEDEDHDTNWYKQMEWDMPCV